MSYTLTITPAAHRLLRKFNQTIRQQLHKKIQRLGEKPELGQPLQGKLSHLRSYHITLNRTGYRVVYEVNHERHEIVIRAVGSREKFYRRLDRMNLEPLT